MSRLGSPCQSFVGWGLGRRLFAPGDAICLSLRVMHVLLGSLGFLCLEIVINCELKHLGTRLWVAEQITSCTTIFGTGAIVLTKGDRFGF